MGTQTCVAQALVSALTPQLVGDGTGSRRTGQAVQGQSHTASRRRGAEAGPAGGRGADSISCTQGPPPTVAPEGAEARSEGPKAPVGLPASPACLSPALAPGQCPVPHHVTLKVSW